MQYKILTLATIAIIFLGIGLSLHRMAPHPPRENTINADGYGGKIPLVISTDTNGRIITIKALAHNETSSYIGDLNDFLRQFIGKSTHDPLMIGQDIDAITGATITSTGVTNAVKKKLAGTHTKDADKIPGSSRKADKSKFIPALFSALFLITAILALVLKNTPLRWLSMIGGFILFGIIHQSMLSIIQVINAARLAIPPLDINNLWIITLVIGFIPTIMIGRIYCGSLCPFALVQEISFRLLPRKFCQTRISPRTDSRAKLIKYALAIGLIALCIVINSTAPAEIEPFVTLFTRHASWMAWIFLGVMLILSLFYFRFWCIYFCPVGGLTGLTARFSLFKLKAS